MMFGIVRISYNLKVPGDVNCNLITKQKKGNDVANQS